MSLPASARSSKYASVNKSVISFVAADIPGAMPSFDSDLGLGMVCWKSRRLVLENE